MYINGIYIHITYLAVVSIFEIKHIRNIPSNLYTMILSFSKRYVPIYVIKLKLAGDYLNAELH